MVAQVSRIGRTHRSADADHGTDNSLAEIEMACATGHIGNHKRHQNGEHRGGDPVEQLDRNERIGVCDRGKQKAPKRQRRKGNEEERPPSPCLCLLADLGRKDCDDKLRPDNRCRDHQGRPLAGPHR